MHDLGCGWVASQRYHRPVLSLILLGASHAAPVLLDDVRIVDARGDLGTHDVLLAQGRITALDPVELPADTERHDCTGLTVVPGLIDAHVHITQQPGGAFLPEGVHDEARQSQHLAAYLAWGVTTVVDPGITAADAREVEALAETAVSPRLIFQGPLLGPTGGYPSAIIPELAGVASPEQVRAAMDEFEGLDAGALKLTMEDGPLGTVWPLHDPEVVATIQSEAQARGLELWVHAMDPEMTRRALELEPAVLVHASQRGRRRLARQVAEAEVTVITTLDILAGEAWAGQPDRLDARQLELSVPGDERGLVFDADVRQEMFELGLDMYSPGMSSWLRGAVLGSVERGGMARRRTGRAGRFLLRLRDAGVPLVVGSDAGGSPIVPWLLHGPATHLELAALQDTGSRAAGDPDRGDRDAGAHVGTGAGAGRGGAGGGPGAGRGGSAGRHHRAADAGVGGARRGGEDAGGVDGGGAVIGEGVGGR